MQTKTDEQLIKMYKQGNDEALDFLLNKYKYLAIKVSRSYFLIGAESEDLLQEAMIGLYSACRNFNEKHSSSFKNFATLCITRAVQSAVKIANRQKYKYLNESLSLSNEGEVKLNEKNEYGENISFFIPSNIPDPEFSLIEHERHQKITKLIHENLSIKEKKVLYLYLQGLTYSQISEKLGENIKAVDNAISRTKKKLEELI